MQRTHKCASCHGTGRGFGGPCNSCRGTGAQNGFEATMSVVAAIVLIVIVLGIVIH